MIDTTFKTEKKNLSREANGLSHVELNSTANPACPPNRSYWSHRLGNWGRPPEGKHPPQPADAGRGRSKPVSRPGARGAGGGGPAARVTCPACVAPVDSEETRAAQHPGSVAPRLPADTALPPPAWSPSWHSAGPFPICGTFRSSVFPREELVAMAMRASQPRTAREAESSPSTARPRPLERVAAWGKARQ